MDPSGSNQLSDTTFARARQVMTNQQLVDLVTLSGTQSPWC